MEEKMRIDVDKIQDQVRREVMAEQKYWRENDAKMRAVEQRVPTYEDFKQIVLASHLKPLDKGETLRNAKLLNNNTWNLSAVGPGSGGSAASLDAPATTPAGQTSLPDEKPTNGPEFRRAWQKLPDLESRWRLLGLLGPDAVQGQFKSELNSDQLAEFILFIEQKLKEPDAAVNDVNLAYALLKTFSECKRFSLNKMFLKPAEKEAFKSAAERLKTIADSTFSAADVDKLVALYN